jgi:hypothetical protein
VINPALLTDNSSLTALNFYLLYVYRWIPRAVPRRLAAAAGDGCYLAKAANGNQNSITI